MYETGDGVPLPDLAGGTSLLISGPPMVGKRDLGLRLLAAGSNAGGGAIVVTTDTGRQAIQADYAAFLDGDLQVPVGVVDCTTDDGGDGGLVYSASSPADLTGVGMGVSTLLDYFSGEAGLERTRVGVFALTPMFLYADTDRVLQFAHGLTGRIAEAGAVGFLVAHSDTIEADALAKVRSLVDGTLEVREREGKREVRLQSPDRTTEWRPLGDPATRAVTGTPGGNGTGRPAEGTGEPAARAPDGESAATETLADVPESLAAIIEGVGAERPTLSVYNYGRDPDHLDRLAAFCERLNVAFRERSLPDEDPTDVAMLHRGTDFIDAAPVQSLLGALEVTASGEEAFADTDRPGLLSDLEYSTFGARGADRSFLVEISHVIETEAWRMDDGTLHAGFQELRRLWSDPETRRIYRRLAESGVEVHAYGRPGGDPPDWSGVTLHPLEAAEISEAWFVVYDGGGRPDAKATLLVREDAPGVYEGFWSYRPEVTDRTLSYLTRTYGVGRTDGTGRRPEGPDPDPDPEASDSEPEERSDDSLPAA